MRLPWAKYQNLFTFLFKSFIEKNSFLNKLTLPQKIEGLFILRKDCLKWAIPGGMIDLGETAIETAKRELLEEAGIEINFSKDKILYEGYVDDPRNTDNAWMETTFFHKHLSSKNVIPLQMKTGDDTDDAQFKVIDENFMQYLYASHKYLVQKALKII